MQSASGTMQASFAMLMVAFILALAAIAVNWGSGPVTMQGVTLPPEPKLSYAGPIYEGHGEWDYKGTAMTSKGFLERRVRRNAELIARAKAAARRVTQDEAAVKATDAKLGQLRRNGVKVDGIKWTKLEIHVPGLERDIKTAGQLFKKGVKQVSSLAQGLEDGLSIRDRGITYDRPIKALTHV